MNNIEIYQKSLDFLISNSNESLPVQSIIREKVHSIAVPIPTIAASNDLLDKARTVSLTLGIPETSPDFRIVMEACHHFTIVRNEAKHFETELFDVNTLIPPSLIPVYHPHTREHTMVRYAARSAPEILEMCDVFKTDAVRNFSTLDPQRLVLHNFARRFILNYAPKSELSEDLAAIVPSLSQRFLKEHPNFSMECSRLRKDIEERSLKYLQNEQESDLPPQWIESLKKLKDRTSNTTPSDQKNRAIAMRYADLVVEDYIKQMVNEYDLSKTPELQDRKPLSPQTKQTRRTFMINGGIASGKSSSLEIQIREAAKQAIHWQDVMCLNRDALKSILIKKEDLSSDTGPEYVKFYPTFAEDESFILRDSILKEYQERLSQDNAPHIYIDQVYPNADMLLMAGDPEGLGLDLIIVQAPVENSIRMAYNRGRQAEQYAYIRSLLLTHSQVPKRLLDSLETAKAAGKTQIRIQIVANITRGEIHLVASMNLANHNMQIQDRDNLRQFFRKTTINPDAVRFEDIYSSSTLPLDQFDDWINRLESLIKTT